MKIISPCITSYVENGWLVKPITCIPFAYNSFQTCLTFFLILKFKIIFKSFEKYRIEIYVMSDWKVSKMIAPYAETAQ